MQNCNTVRKRALHYLATLKENGFSNELPLEQARNLFSQILGIWDRTTLKAYFGAQAHQSTQRLRRRAQYQSGVVSFKTIELSRDISAYPGYLERMGLVSYSLKGKLWFMKIESAVLVPQLMKVDVSMRNFSLSPIEAITNVRVNDADSMTQTLKGSRSASFLAAPNIEVEKKQTNNNLQDEREKTGSVECEDSTQTLAHLKVLAEAGKRET